MEPACIKILMQIHPRSLEIGGRELLPMFGIPRKNLIAGALVGAGLAVYVAVRSGPSAALPPLEPLPPGVVQAFEKWKSPFEAGWANAELTALADEPRLRKRIGTLVHAAPAPREMEILALKAGRSGGWPALVILLLVAIFLGMAIAFRWRHPHYGISCGGIGDLQAPLGGSSILSLLILNTAVGSALIWLLFIQDHRKFLESRRQLVPNTLPVSLTRDETALLQSAADSSPRKRGGRENQHQ